MTASSRTFLLALWAAVLAAAAHATSVLVDFNNINTSTLVANDPTPAPGPDGRYYNNVLLPYGGGQGTSTAGAIKLNGAASLALVDTNNTSTGWTLTVDKNNASGAVGPSGSGANYAGPYPAGVDSFAFPAVTDGIYLNQGAVLQVNFTGLSAAKTYDLLIYAARGNTAGTVTNTLVVGTSASPLSVSYYVGTNATVAPAWAAITPNSNGQIAFTVATEFSANATALNFIQLTETASHSPPAPPIGINFSNGDADKSLLATDSAGIVAQTNWNAAPNAAGTQVTMNLKDSSGTATTAYLTTTFGYANANGGGTGTANDKLYRAYGLMSGSEAVTVANLPAAVTSNRYDVILYFDINLAISNRTCSYTLGSATWAGIEDTGFFSGTFKQAAGTDLSTTSQGNYVRFTGLTNSSFTIAGAANAGARAPVCGIQIVPNATDPPVIVSFTASTNAFNPGDRVTLSWNVTNATSVSLYPGIGTVAAAGSVVLAPGATTTYVLTALNGAAQVSAQLTLTQGVGPVDVYLLGGQSNMQGLGNLSELTPAQLTPPTNVYYWNGSSFVPFIPGTTVTSTAGNFGPEIAFATEICKLGRKAYLIKEYSSGKPLDSGWNDQTWVGDPPAPNRVNFYPGTNAVDPNQGTLYKNLLVPNYRAGIQSIIAQGGTPAIRGLVWMQGEQDSKTNISAGRYAADLKRLRDRLASDLGLTNLPVTFGQVLPYTPPAARFVCRDLIRAQQAAADMFSGLPESIPHCRMVSTDGFPIYSSDQVHYTTAGQIMLGTAFAQGIQEAEFGVSLTPVNLTSNISGDTLTLAWPSDHIGWRLLVQTNHLAAGVSANINDWMTVAGSSATNQLSIPIGATNACEFYRLVYP